MTITFNRRQFLTGALYTTAALTLSGCGGESKPVEPETKEYIDESEIDAMFTSPNDYKGKWVKLPGKTLGSSQREGDVTGLQVYYDMLTYDRSYIVNSDTTESFSDGEYILVDGKIEGVFEGENAFGGNLTFPYITQATITKSTYMEVVAPALATIEPAVSVTQNDVTFTCDKVEFADIETRIYLTIANGSESTVTWGAYNTRAIVNGQQINQDNSSSSAYEGDYPQLGYDVSAGASTSGILVFPPMESGKAFTLIIPDIYSDNYEITFTDVELEIPEG